MRPCPIRAFVEFLLIGFLVLAISGIASMAVGAVYGLFTGGVFQGVCSSTYWGLSIGGVLASILIVISSYQWIRAHAWYFHLLWIRPRDARHQELKRRLINLIRSSPRRIDSVSRDEVERLSSEAMTIEFDCRPFYHDIEGIAGWWSQQIKIARIVYETELKKYQAEFGE